MSQHLRDYQRKAIDAANAAIQSHGSALIVAPTGVGKTVVFSELARQHSEHGRVLILAERRDLIFQTADKIRRFAGVHVDIEMGSLKSGNGMYGDARIVVASRQTLAKDKRRSKFTPDDFALVIFDEAHHAAKHVLQYRQIIDHFDGVKMIGVTATPDRGDKGRICGPDSTFATLAFDYPLYHHSQPSAITDGWLVDIKQRIVHVKGLDYASLVVSKGDFAPGSIASQMSADAQTLHGLCSKMHEITQGRKTAVFCATIAQAEATAACLENYLPAGVRVICQKTDREDRKNYLRWFAETERGYMVSVDALCEGWDDPGIQYVAICRPTKSRPRYCQMVGRGTRPLLECVQDIDTAEERRRNIAASDKPHLTVLDFVGSTADLQLSVSVADLLAESMDLDIQPDVLARAKALTDESPSTTVQENLLRAKEVFDAERAIERALAAKEHAERLNQLRFERAVADEIEIDPFGNRFEFSQETRWWETTRQNGASVKQVELLVALGISPEKAASFSKRQAGSVIDAKFKAKEAPNWKRCSIARRQGRMPERSRQVSAA